MHILRAKERKQNLPLTMLEVEINTVSQHYFDYCDLD